MSHTTLVRDFLEATAARLPSKTALICDGRRWCYAELDAAANQFANLLIASGVARGDRVAICLRNSAEAVIGIFAAVKASAVFVPLNHGIKRDKLAYVLNNCAARALITDSAHADVGELVPSLESVVVSFAAADEFPATPPPRNNIDLDLACLIYTSGSTGEPKGVMSDHCNVAFASGAIIQYLGNREDDVVLNVLPLSFDYGLYQLLMTFRFGGTLVLENSFAYPATILQRIAEERVTGFPGVPTIFAMLLKMDLRTFDLSSLRYVTNTAAALPPSHIEELRRALPHVRLFSMYGLTETKRTLYLPPEWLEKKPGSVGIPIPGTEVWLEDESGRRLGANQIGELVVRGRHVMRGYWGDAELSAQRFPFGAIPGERVCRTGDLFRMDDDGCFYFIARKDDIIKSRGEKVAPKEVEVVLYGLPGVVEAAVFGVPDPLLGQAVKAVLATDGRALTPAQVIFHCRKHLEEFMVPKHVEFCSALPKSPSGKIQKRELTCAASPASAT
jgi:long-chain acyl-CoA synthetase